MKSRERKIFNDLFFSRRFGSKRERDKKTKKNRFLKYQILCWNNKMAAHVLTSFVGKITYFYRFFMTWSIGGGMTTKRSLRQETDKKKMNLLSFISSRLKYELKWWYTPGVSLNEKELTEVNIYDLEIFLKFHGKKNLTLHQLFTKSKKVTLWG